MSQALPCPLSHREQLPPAILPIGEMLGDGPLLALLDSYGGTRLYVPEKVAEGDGLATKLGLDPAGRLVAAFGRDTVVVPLCKKWRGLMLRQQGYSYAAIGRQIGMHEQSVYRMLTPNRTGQQKRMPVEAQLRLFQD